MKEVLPNVFIGDLNDLKNNEAMEQNDIRYLISVFSGPIELPLAITNHQQIFVDDVADADLLSKFGKCEEFITACLEKGHAVLVHCLNGISRSATIIMAYIMASQQLPCPKAFRVLKKKYKAACPNEGFRNQLKLFEEIGYKLDRSHPEYRMYVLEKAIEDFQENIGEIPLAPNPTSTSVAASAILLSCRKCRLKLGVAENIFEHEPGSGQTAFRWHKRNPDNHLNLQDPSQNQECSSMFMEPMKWMEPSVEDRANQGKLVCPKCASRFGTFNWSGSQCSCGSWITPSFQLNKARVDVIIKKNVRRALAISNMTLEGESTTTLTRTSLQPPLSPTPTMTTTTPPPTTTTTTAAATTPPTATISTTTTTTPTTPTTTPPPGTLAPTTIPTTTTTTPPPVAVILN